MTDTPQQPTEPAAPQRILDVRWMMRMGAIVVVLGLFVTLAWQNAETVEVEFLGWAFETPMIVLLIGSAVVGIVIWELAGFVRRRRKKAG